MATTLPEFTRVIDNAFTQTWYDIRPTAIDQILLATPIWALLKMKGCFKKQRGSEIITRTVRYAIPEAKEVDHTDLLGQGTYENRTMAQWPFRFLSIHIQRSAFEDRANAGSYKISDYVKDRMKDAYDALRQRYERDVMRTEVTDETGKNIQSILDIVPAYANRATGTYGKIVRKNTWWQPNYQAITGSVEVELLSAMKSFFNTVTAQLEEPDMIVTTQEWFEMYEEFGLDAVQIVGNQKMLDLGFNVLKFKGKELFWTPNAPANTMRFLNSNRIEVVYDPGMWFEMTEWKPIFNQTDRIAHILCAMNIINTEPRRHGLLYK